MLSVAMLGLPLPHDIVPDGAGGGLVIGGVALGSGGGGVVLGGGQLLDLGWMV